jgi:hypothetical protein
MMLLKTYIKKIPEGLTFGLFHDKKYAITKQTFNQGKSFKIYGRVLQGTDFISLNYYITKKKDLLRPCEMTREKVIDFLTNVKFML